MRCFRCMEEILDDNVKCEKCGTEIKSQSKAPFHLKVGTILKDQYLIGLALGSGGFGITYIGYDTILQRKIAIKEYFPSDFATRAQGITNISVFNSDIKVEQFEKGLGRFIEEGQKLAKFNSVSAIVDIYDSFIENSTGYIVMEYLEGITLKEYMKLNGKLTYDESIEMILPVIQALEQVHKDGIIHRDIAPDNIYLTIKQGTKLLDFGAARYATTSESKSLSVILKLGYAPEEQYQSKGEQGPWTDVYALCATMYHMMTGVIPQESIERVAIDKVKMISKMGVKIPKNAEITIMNGLNIRLDNRIQNMSDLKESLLGDLKVKRKKEKGLIEDIGQWPKWMKLFVPSFTIVALSVMLLVVTGVIDFKSLLTDTKASWEELANVPNVINMSLDDAIKEAQEAGFQIATDEGKIESDYYLKDTIISQTPLFGGLVSKNEKIQVAISAGPTMIEVGYLMDKDVEKIKSDLEALGFVVEIIEVSNQNYFNGAIISQSITPYTEYGRKGKIKLEYSLGNDELVVGNEINIPNIIGQNIDDARKKVVENGLYIELTETIFTDSDDDINKVMKQETGVKKSGDNVQITISKGLLRFFMPDVQLQNQQTAIKMIEDLGAKKDKIIIKEEYNQTVTKGQVISQSIESGTRITTNDEIEIVISKGPSEFTIPSLSGKNIDQAQKILIDLQIPKTIIKIEKANSEEVHSNLVMKQSVKAGDILNIEDTITLTQSLGGTQSEWVNKLPDGVDAANYEIVNDEEYRVQKTKKVLSEWSSWSDGVGSKTEDTNIKNQYQTQQIEYKESSDSNLAGYTQYKDPTTTISNNCTTSTNASSSTDSTNVSTYVDTTYENKWVSYEYYGNYALNNQSSGDFKFGLSVFSEFKQNGSADGNSTTKCDTQYYSFRDTTDYNKFNSSLYKMENQFTLPNKCSGMSVYSNVAFRRDIYEKVEINTTYYKSCPINYTYYYKKEHNWSGWSNGVGIGASDTLNVRVQYATQQITKQPDGDWSQWSMNFAENTDTQDVEIRPIYKYKFK